MQISTFNIRNEAFAIHSLLVEEYFRPLPITKVPGADPRIDGLVNIRGRTAVVINMRRCFEVPERESTNHGEMILLETSQRLVQEALDRGLYAFDEPVVLNVDSVSQIHHLMDEEIHPSPPHVTQPFVDGVIHVNEKFFTLVSIQKLIASILQPEAQARP
ncbi:MAG: chemotaxis protein CheW [Pirellula sp.]|jgi:chemotaxis signal transduction protein|nr:chemotaxis protein CheW [Pirellula sp.]